MYEMSSSFYLAKVIVIFFSPLLELLHPTGICLLSYV